MKIGVSAFAWTSDFSPSHLSLLASIREHGLAAVEVAMFDPAKLDTLALRRGFETHGLGVTVCAILPAGINPISPDYNLRRHSFEHLVRCIETATELGARLIAGPVYAPIGYLPGRRRNGDEWSWAVDCIQRLGPSLESNGVTLCIEPVNRGETFFLTTIAEAAEFCEAVGHPRVGITVDTFHSNIEEKNIAAAILRAGGFIKHIHASENDRGVPGTGHVDFPAIVAALNQTRYTGYLMIEGMGNAPDESGATLALWRDPVASPEDIAFGGYDYLARLLQ